MNLDKLNYLKPLLQAEIESGKLFGCAVTVGYRGERVFTAEFGDIKADTPCMLCSMTKPITNIAAWILIERGIIDPLEEVGKYLPAFQDQLVYENGKLVPAERKLLIRDVLNMVSGIPSTKAKSEREEYCALEVQKMLSSFKARIDNGEKISNLEIINGFGRVPLLFQPGKEWNYGKNADVIGGIVEVASNIPLGEFFQKNIFEPLDMKNTGFVITKELAEKVPKIAVEKSGRIEAITSQQFYGDTRELYEAPCTESGGGGNAPIMSRGVYSTLDDYAKLCNMLANDGVANGKRFLSPKTIELFMKNQLTDEQRVSFVDAEEGYGYANLMRVLMHPEKGTGLGTVGEFGWDGALGTYMTIDPVNGLYIVYMQQKHPDMILRRKMRAIIYSALTEL